MWIKNSRSIISILLFIGLFALVFVCAAPMNQGNLTSRYYTVFNGQLITGTGSATSGTIDLSDSQYFGLGYIQTGTNPSVNLTYDQSFDGSNWIVSVGTVTSGFTSTSAAGGSLSLPVAPLVRFKLTGTGSNGSSTFTCWGMKQ